MPRTILTDIRWELLLQVMKSTGRIYDKTEHRMRPPQTLLEEIFTLQASLYTLNLVSL